MRFTSNLQAIRLIAAFLILLRHSLILLGDDNTLSAIRFPAVGIWVFFTISGYLLPGSWMRNPRLWEFARARFQRLAPSFVIVIAASALCLGPVLSQLPATEYFRNPQTWDYFLNLALKPMYALPGVFVTNPYPYAVNGSIWSLPPQVLTYALIPLVFLLRSRALRTIAWAGVLLTAVWDSTVGRFDETVIWGNNVSQALVVIGFFAVGALLREIHVPFKVPAAGALLIVLIVGTTVFPAASYAIQCLTIPYVVLTVSLRSWPILRAVNRLPDISYGIFLVGFPVQQTVLTALPAISPYLSIGITVVVAIVVALALELLVDRPIVRWSERRRGSPPRTDAPQKELG